MRRVLHGCADRAVRSPPGQGDHRSRVASPRACAGHAGRAAMTPDAPALSAADGRVTYAQLEARASALRDRLAESGVRPGDVVAVYLPRSAALATALLGVLTAGTAFCVLDPAYPEGRLAAQVTIARPAAVLCAAAG